jgi:hypothetical protein
MAKFLNPELQFDFRTDNLLAQVDRALRQAGGRHVLYSSEFLEDFQTDRLRALNDYAVARGYELVVAYYVRPIADHASSLYGQLVRAHGLTTSLAEFLPTYDCPFQKTIERLLPVVPSQRILVFNYDAARHALCEHFTTNVLALETQMLISVGVVNRSLSPVELAEARQRNSNSGPEDREAAREASFDPSQLTELSERYANAITFVNSFIRNEAIGVCSMEHHSSGKLI